MKKFRFLVPVLAALCLTLCFTQCKKDHDCKMVLRCILSTNGVDTIGLAKGAYVYVDTTKYNYYYPGDTINGSPSGGHQCYTDQIIRDAHGYATDGTFSYTFHHPALLNMIAVYSDTLWDEEGNVAEIHNYSGGTQVQVNDGETTEKTIVLVETF